MKKILVGLLVILMSMLAHGAGNITSSSRSTLDSSYNSFNIQFSVDSSSVDSATFAYYLYISLENSLDGATCVDSVKTGFTSPDTLKATKADIIGITGDTLVLSALKFYYWVLLKDTALAGATVDTSAGDSISIAAFPFTATYSYSSNRWISDNVYHVLWFYDQSQDSNYVWIPDLLKYTSFELWVRKVGLDNNYTYDTAKVSLYSGEFGLPAELWSYKIATDTGQYKQVFDLVGNAFAADTVGGSGGPLKWGRELGLWFTVTDTTGGAKNAYYLDDGMMEAYIYFRK